MAAAISSSPSSRTSRGYSNNNNINLVLDTNATRTPEGAVGTLSSSSPTRPLRRLSRGSALVSAGVANDTLAQPPSQQRVSTSAAAAATAAATGASAQSQPLQQQQQQATLTRSRDVRRALAQLSLQASDLDAHVIALREDARQRIAHSRTSLSGLGGQVRLIADEARVLEDRLAKTGQTAERISESVRRLDREIERVQLARLWTEKVADLKASLQSMAAAMEQHDYAVAAQHCVRALAIDPSIVSSHFASIVVPSSDYPDPPPVMLQQLRLKLLAVFTERFEKATEARDTVEATHFFVMFPQVGWKKEGLAVYSRFARSIVRERGRAVTDSLGPRTNAPPTHHANLLTILFENLALLVDQHQPLVDRHYGPGNFARGVMPGLQEECDRLGKRVCETWSEERAVRRKLAEANAYSFSFVAAIGTTSKKSVSGAQRGQGGFSIPLRPSTPSGAREAQSDEMSTQPDTREVDRIASELAAMAARWGTYRRFLRARLQVEFPNPESERLGEEKSDGLRDFRRASSGTTPLQVLPESKKTEMSGRDTLEEIGPPLDIAASSTLGQRIDELLENVYVPMESWFLRCSVEKAHRMDVPDSAARPMTSPLLDDVFYLMRLVLARAVATSNLTVLSTLCRHVRYIMDEDFVQALVRLLDLSARSAGTSMSVEGPRKDAASREMRSTFGVYLNVLSTSAVYMTRILDELTAESSIAQHYTSDEIGAAVTTVQSLAVLVPRIRNAVRTHSDLLFSTLLRPKIRQLLSDSLRDVNYVLDEEGFARAEDETNAHGGMSLFVRRFTRGWESVVNGVGYRDILTPDNWEMLLRLAVDAVVQAWEIWVMNVEYSELGALRFDKDLRTISTFLSSNSSTGGLRERFARLTHISYLLNLDEDEASAAAAIGAAAPAGAATAAGPGAAGLGSNGAEAGRIAPADSTHTFHDPLHDASPDANESIADANDDFAWRLSADEVRHVRQRRIGW